MNLGQKLSSFFTEFASSPEKMVAVIVSVIVFAVFFYFLLKFLIINQANSLVVLLSLSMVIFACVITLTDALSNVVFLCIPIVFTIAILCLYTVEIKRLIWGKQGLKMADTKHANETIDSAKIENCINEIIKALQNMSKNDVGALIVLSSDGFPHQIIDSGVVVESDITSALIESIFFPKTPLHDGAMIINGTKIVAAGCFLPLSQKDNIPKELGTRHRAGIGVTETIDVVSLIVSEETGIISIVKEGKITRYADAEMLKKTLVKYYWQEIEATRRK